MHGRRTKKNNSTDTRVHVMTSDGTLLSLDVPTPLQKSNRILDDVVIGLCEGQFQSHQDKDEDRLTEIQLFWCKWHIFSFGLFLLNEKVQALIKWSGFTGKVDGISWTLWDTQSLIHFFSSGVRLNHHDDDGDVMMTMTETHTHTNVHAQTTITIPLGDQRKYCSFYEFHKNLCWRSCWGSKETILFHSSILAAYFVVHVTFCIHMRMQ